MTNPNQGTLFAEEPLLYVSPNDPGYFSCLVQHTDGKKAQSSFPLDRLPFVLRNLNPRLDTWISQATFWRPNRRVINLRSISLVFADIDCYKSEWSQGLDPQEMAQKFRSFCEQQGVWDPSIILFSGRGLQVKWFFKNPIPRQALPRWNFLERWIVDRFLDYGADPRAKDASRVLRVEHTINSKSGKFCRVVYENLDDEGETKRYDFESMFNAVAPISRDEYRRQRDRLRIQTEAWKKAGRDRRAKVALDVSTLYWDRLEDLRKLCRIRGGVKEGHRMSMLFHMTICLSFCGLVEPATFFSEMYALANQIDPRWHVSKSEVSTLYVRLKELRKGTLYEYNGRKYPAMYTPKNRTVIAQLEITAEEQRQMKSLIDSCEKARRKVERRREAGMMPRQEYEGRSHARRERAYELIKEGVNVGDAAKQMQLSSRHVIRLLNSFDVRVSPSEVKRQKALELFAQGKSKAEIARRLGVSRTQVYSYLKSKR